MTKLEKLKTINSLNDFGDLIGFKPKAITYILYKLLPEEKYIDFSIPKKNGSQRIINSPTNKLKLLQKRLSNLLSDCFEEIYTKNTLSHGFRRNYSIITNAKKHKNKRYVLNLDLKDFFPTFNFGRVRGFFIKNKDFNLDKKIATVIAQIATHNNELPQGSPCSPIISNLITHILDIRMASLAKKFKCTYSRYADDLTFSTNQKDFPKEIAYYKNNNWILSDTLIYEIQKRAGFIINQNKTAMQYKTSRQLTTGLIVNKSVNIKNEYYRKARSMCNELFKSNKFYLDKENKEVCGTLNQLNGILSFIYKVKEKHYCSFNNTNIPTAVTNLYRKFLFYKYFFALKAPLIICEGKTDSIYLKCALKQLASKYNNLVEIKDNKVTYKIKFLNKTSNTIGEVFHMAPGVTGLLNLMNVYEKYMRLFKTEGKFFPVILLVDNDSGAGRIKSRIKEQNKNNSKNNINYCSFAENLYVLFIPEDENKAIEDLFDKSILDTKIDGKVFNRSEDIDTNTEYGKIIFAEKVIKKKQKEINFEKFSTVFDNLNAILSDYNTKITK